MKKRIVFCMILIITLMPVICSAASAASNTTYDKAVKVSFNTGYTDQDITSAAPFRWFKVVLPSSGLLRVRTDAVKKYTYDSALLYLYDNGVNEMDRVALDFNNITLEALQTVSWYLKAGTYYVKYTPTNYGCAGYGTIATLNVRFIFDPTGETLPESQKNSNDTYSTADSIRIGVRCREQISRFGDRVDRYTFTKTGSGPVAITCKAFMSEISITVKDDQGTVKWTTTLRWNDFVGYGEMSQEVSLEAGIYYLDLESSNGSSGIYEFSVSKPVTAGDTIIVSDMKYRVTGAGSVSFAGLLKPSSKTTVNIPSVVTYSGKTYQVTAIAAKALYKDAKVSSVTVGKNVRTIGKNAFALAVKLAAVKGCAAVEEIGDTAFNGCRALRSFPVMTRLRTVGSGAFKNCVKLPKFTLGSSLRSIGKAAFYGCGALKTITVKAAGLKSGSIGGNAFRKIHRAASFICPSKHLAAYQKLFVKGGAPKTSSFK